MECKRGSRKGENDELMGFAFTNIEKYYSGDALHLILICAEKPTKSSQDQGAGIHLFKLLLEYAEPNE